MNALRDEKRETRAERRESETALPCHLNEGRSCGLIVKKKPGRDGRFFFVLNLIKQHFAIFPKPILS
jgi:hypothetical protein